MDLDLNLEPLDQPRESELQLQSTLVELVRVNGEVGERIRQLGAVARQRQWWRQGPTLQHRSVETPIGGVLANGNHGDRLQNGEDGFVASEGTVQGGKGGGKEPQLPASAAGMNKTGDSGGFFDCNVCLELARDPVLTCCGHLFCWPCFYQISDVRLNVKKCPACHGEVMNTSIIPIYGAGNGSVSRKSEASGLNVPPRPHAQRIESSRRLVESLVRDRIQLIRNFVRTRGGRWRSDYFNGRPEMAESPNFSQELSATETNNNISRQPLRSGLQRADSFISLFAELSSAMDRAIRLTTDLESYLHGAMRRQQQTSANEGGRSSTSLAGVMQPESGYTTSIGEIDSVFRPSALPSRTHTGREIANLGNQTMINTATDINSPNDAPGVLDLNDEVLHEPRRRRFR